ncbi:MAG: sulfatase [Opitutales bacterium]
MNKTPPAPNILLAIADDMSWPHAGAYGCEWIRTPHLDGLAQRGTLFRQAFCPAPQCSPSRAALLTGRNIWQIEEAGVHCSRFPRKWPTYTEVLQDHGYHVGYTCKGWAPGDWQSSGWPHNPAGREYNSERHEPPEPCMSPIDYNANFTRFLADREPGQPFCFWFGCKEPHRPYEPGQGKRGGRDEANAGVPGYLPDDPIVRSDLLDYGREIEYYDEQLGKMLAQIEAAGELDNTLVIVTSDNGMPFPRAKANLYEQSLRIPLVAAWPAGLPGGVESNQLVSLIDLAPTILEAAGLPIPETIAGRSLLPLMREEPAPWDRDEIFAGRERHARARAGNAAYPCRSLRTKQFLLIRNLTPERWPAGDPEKFADIDPGPTKRFLLEHRDAERVAPFFELACAKRPALELYDLKEDPEALHNIVDHPDYAGVKQDLLSRLEDRLLADGDPRACGRGDIFDDAPYTVPPNPAQIEAGFISAPEHEILSRRHPETNT